MSKKMLIVMTAVLTLGLVLTGCTQPQEARVGDPAPDFQLPNLNGEKISLSDFKGKPILLNFWATTCSFCQVEMPHVQEIYEEWSDKGLVLLAVSVDTSQPPVDEYMRSNSFSFPVLLDSKRDIAHKYNVKTTPTTFFIDKNGVIQIKIAGPFPGKEAIEDRLEKIMS